MSDPDVPETGARPGYRRLRQQCPRCYGDGTVTTITAAVSDGRSASFVSSKPCTACKDGWIDRGWVRTT